MMKLAVHYGLAALFVTAAAGLAWLSRFFLGAEPIVSLMVCAVLLTAWIGGRGPALFSVAFAIPEFAYLFTLPVQSADDWLRLILFAVVTFLVAWISSGQSRTAASLRIAKDELARTVRKLDTLNASLRRENADRLRAEEQSRKSQDALQTTIDTIPAIVARYRADGTPEFINQRWRNYTGVSNEDVRLHHWTSMVHPDDLPLVDEAWRAHLTKGEPFELEQRLRRSDGIFRWHLLRRVPLRDANGDVINWFAVAHDIEDEKRARHALQRGRAYLAEAQRLSKTGSFGWNVATGELFLTEETRRIMAFDKDVKPNIELVLERVHPDDRQLVQMQLDRAVQDHENYDYEHRLLMPDGRTRYVHVRARGQKYEHGETELIGAVMDVTDMRCAQDALEAAQMELAHAARVAALGEMSASLAHEVNQPLAAILTSAEAGLRWLSRADPDIDETLDAIKRIISNAHRASEVVRRIRRFAKKADLEMAPHAINEIVHEAVALLRQHALRFQTVIRLDLQPGLPRVRGDRIQLQQVLINLVVNGMQAMRQVDDRERVVTIRTRLTDKERIEVTVHDVGVGTAPDSLPRLFAPFFTTKADGLGIGLSICRSIIEGHGGRISGAPNQGPGMTFQFTVPVSPTDRVAA